MAEQRSVFYVGEKFSTYEEFADKLKNYENTTFVNFGNAIVGRSQLTQHKRSK